MDFSTAISQPNDGRASGIGAFDAAVAAPEFSPIPPGVYAAKVVCGGLTQTKAGIDAYRIRFEISEGEHAGKSVVRTWTFSAKAIAYTKRDLAIFGLATAADLLAPFPPLGEEFSVRLVVALQRGGDGIERNDVKRVELIRATELSPTLPLSATELLFGSKDGPYGAEGGRL